MCVRAYIDKSIFFFYLLSLHSFFLVPNIIIVLRLANNYYCSLVLHDYGAQYKRMKPRRIMVITAIVIIIVLHFFFFRLI